jgi:hypothetical protein
MVKYDSKFKTCFLDAHAEELQTHIMALLDPLLDPVKLVKKDTDIHRQLRGLLFGAFSFRSRCFPTDSIRYEVIQFQPGQCFDPATMEAQDVAGNRVSVPADKKRYIKLCVHGLIVAHTFQGGSSSLQRIKELGQPFQTSEAQKEGDTKTGKIIGDKAIVILQSEDM